jgi:antitoxin component YwqK of YwqJK toxin-antitoxin module
MLYKILKMKILISIFTLLFALSIQAQNITDSKGLKQGPWETKYPKGTLKYKGVFKDGKPVGEFKRFYETGSLRIAQTFRTNGSSFAKVYYENGVLAAEGKYLGEKKDSIWRYYSYYEKVLRMTETYKNGSLEGLTCRYHNNGKVSEELTYVNGKKNGPWKQYTTDGKLSLKATYVNDERTGVFTTFYENGMIEINGRIENGLAEGAWRYFDENGNEKSVINYSKGIADTQLELDKQQQEFMMKLEMNKGRIPEPSENDVKF